jgi:large subunit ribosomal protein L31
VMTTGSTSPEIHVDVWSGNHPFYTGTQKILDTEGRVDRFMRKYGMGGADSAASASKKAAPANTATAETVKAETEAGVQNEAAAPA